MEILNLLFKAEPLTIQTPDGNRYELSTSRNGALIINASENISLIPCTACTIRIEKTHVAKISDQ